MTLRGTWGLEGRANFNVLSYLWLVRTGSKLFSLDFFPFSFKMNIAQLHMDHISPEVPQAHGRRPGGFLGNRTERTGARDHRKVHVKSILTQRQGKQLECGTNKIKYNKTAWKQTTDQHRRFWSTLEPQENSTLDNMWLLIRQHPGTGDTGQLLRAPAVLPEDARLLDQLALSCQEAHNHLPHPSSGRGDPPLLTWAGTCTHTYKSTHRLISTHN